MLAPNKQNLLLLKGQKKTIASGYKLLKEKQTGLILTFLDLARKGKALEKEVSGNLNVLIAEYLTSLGLIPSQSLINALPSIACMDLDVTKKRISGVYIEFLTLHLNIPRRPLLKSNIATSLTNFGEYFPSILELSQLKINCQNIANEIKKVNRQIANLDQKIISIESEIKYITNVLNEKANLEKAVLIKLFG